MRLSREQYMNALTRHNEASGNNYWGEAKRSGAAAPAEPLAVTGARASISAWLPASTDYPAGGGGGSGGGAGGFLPLLTRSADAAAAASVHGFGTKGAGTGVRSFRDAGGGGGVAAYYKPLPLPPTPATAYKTPGDGFERWPSAASSLDSVGGSGRAEATPRATLYDLAQVSPLHPLGLAYGVSSASSPTTSSAVSVTAGAVGGSNSFLVRKERLSPGYPAPPPPLPLNKSLTSGPRAGRFGGTGGSAATEFAAPAAAVMPGREDAGRRLQAEAGDTAAATAHSSALDGGPEMAPSRREGDILAQEGSQEAQRDEPTRLTQPSSAATKEQDAPKSILKTPKAGLAGGGDGEQSYERALRGSLDGGVRIAAHTYFLSLNHVPGKGSKAATPGNARYGGAPPSDGGAAGGSLDGERSATAPGGSRGGSHEGAYTTASRWDQAGGGRSGASSAAVHGPAKSSPGTSGARKEYAAPADGAASGPADRSSSDGGSSEGSSKSSPSSSADRKRSVRFRDSLYELKEFLPWEPIYSDVVDSTGRAIPVMRPYVL